MDQRVKKGLAGAVVGLSIIGGGLFSADLAVEDMGEESTRYAREMLSIRGKVRGAELLHLDAVRGLIERRSNSDEPSSEEWATIETAIDETRAENDTEFLRRLDRLIEQMDSVRKEVRDKAVEHLIKQ